MLNNKGGTAHVSSRDESPLLSMAQLASANFAVPDELQTSGEKSDHQPEYQHQASNPIPVRYFDAVAHGQEVIYEEGISSENGNESELANAAEGYRLATYGDDESRELSRNAHPRTVQHQSSSNKVSQGSSRKQHERLDIHYRTGIEGISLSQRKRAAFRNEIARKHASQSPEPSSGARGRNTGSKL